MHLTAPSQPQEVQQTAPDWAMQVGSQGPDDPSLPGDPASSAGLEPQTLSTPPPPQVSGAAQLPHDRTSPHLSEMVPQ
jgi:hypothetical protein